MSFSILILTHNEARNLPECLKSIQGFDDIVVLDSFSEDETTEIAKAAGARVYQHAFGNFAEQRNWGMGNIPFRYRWVFHLDADERFTPELAAECRTAIEEDRYSGFLVPSKMMLFGRWLKHAAVYPVYQARLVKAGEFRFVQSGHGQREGETRRGVGALKQPYLHYSFNTGFDRWFERHNAYSSQEAAHWLGGHAEQEQAGGPASVARFRKLKRLSRRLPFRPLLVWIYLFALRGGFLDGKAGLAFCSLRAYYEFMINLKAEELKLRSAGKPL